MTKPHPPRLRLLCPLLVHTVLALCLLATASPALADAADAHYRAGLDERRRGNTGAAMAAFRRAVKLRPSYAAAHRGLAGLLRKSGDLDGALRHYERVIALEPKEPLAYAMSGALLLRKKRYADAAKRLRRAVALEPDDLSNYSNLGIALRRTGKLEDAVKVMEQAVQKHPEDFDLLNNLGVVLRKMRRYEEAVIYLQRALAVRGELGTHRNLAIVLRGMERFADAIPEYELVLEQAPDDAGALYDLGNCHEKLGNADTAVETYQRYVKLLEKRDPEGAQRGRDRIKIILQGSL